MWIRASDQLTENVFQLTTPVSSHALILGDSGALVDTSIAALGSRLVREIEKYSGEEFPLTHILLTHAHFDHGWWCAVFAGEIPRREGLRVPANFGDAR